MRRFAVVATVATLFLSVTACGTNDDKSERSAETSVENSRSQGPSEDDDGIDASEPMGELPTYGDAKAIWMETASEGDRQSCETSETEDKDVYSMNEGEYIRFVCADIERFTYMTGADNYDENFDSLSSNLLGRAVFHIPDEVVIAPSGANSEMAKAIQQACGCGEVLGPES